MAPRRDRARRFVAGLVKFVALVAVAGGIGVALGYGLSKLSTQDDDTTAASVGGATTATATAGRTAATPAPATTTSAPPAATTAKAPAPSAPAGALGQVRVRVLGAILHPAGTPEGQAARRSRLAMRVRAINAADKIVTIARPVLGVGKVRIATDPAAETPQTSFGDLAAGETKAVTLRFELAGEATEKITIDRRARINIAGRSLPFRLRVGTPLRPPAPAGGATDGAGQTTP